jgi:predicted dehydrogenase
MPSPVSELVAVCGSDKGRTEAVARKYGVDLWFTDVDAMLDTPGIQAVYVASPVDLHKPHVLAAASRGLHVLCEKPLALNVKECREIVQACSQQGVKLMVAYMMRFHAAHQNVLQMVREGDLGELTFGRAQLAFWYPEGPGLWRQHFARSGGGAIMDVGTHALDLLRMLMGEVADVAGFVDTMTFSYDVDDRSTLLLRFASGAHGAVECAFNGPHEGAANGVEVHGLSGSVLTRGTLGQGSGGEMIVNLPADGRVGEAFEFEPVNTYRAEIEHFAG